MPLRTRDGSVHAVLDVTLPAGPPATARPRSRCSGRWPPRWRAASPPPRLYQDLGAQAARDPLTGLANHRAFHERLAARWPRAAAPRAPAELALLDLDHFKRVNDAHGHQAGDRVLVEVAARLRALARAGDLVARVGGEEFAWLLPETDALAAYAVAERARAAIAAAPFAGRGPPHRLGRRLRPRPRGERRPSSSAWPTAPSTGPRPTAATSTYLYARRWCTSCRAEERAERLERAQALAALRALARAVDAKDRSTREHSERVADLATRWPSGLGWTATRPRTPARRRPGARRGQDRRPRRHPAQARAARPPTRWAGCATTRRSAPRSWPRCCRPTRSRGCATTTSAGTAAATPTASRGGGDPRGRAHHRRGRRLGRDDLRPPLPGRPRPRGRRWREMRSLAGVQFCPSRGRCPARRAGDPVGGRDRPRAAPAGAMESASR